jgi:hypothetical protein
LGPGVEEIKLCLLLIPGVRLVVPEIFQEGRKLCGHLPGRRGRSLEWKTNPCELISFDLTDGEAVVNLYSLTDRRGSTPDHQTEENNYSQGLGSHNDTPFTI